MPKITPRRWLLAIELIVAISVIAYHFVPLWEGRWIQDDAYISFRFAKHLVEGYGLVYNIGARVEGYTNFLWTLLSAFPLMLGAPDPIYFMHGLGALLWLGTYALLLRLGIHLFAAGVWSAPLAMLPLLSHYSYNLWFVSGMETALVSFLTVAMVYFFTLDPETNPRSLLWASLCGVALTMTRPDGVVTLAAVGLVGLALFWRELRQPRRWVVYLLAPAVPFLLIYVPFNAWRVWYYGSFYPNTYYAKAAYLTFYERGWTYLATYLSVYSIVWFLPLLLLGGITARGAARRFVWVSTGCCAAVAFYVVRLGGDFMEWRFVTPVSGLLYPAMIVSAETAVTAFGRRLLSRERWMTANSTGAVAGFAAVALVFLVNLRANEKARQTTIPGQESIQLLARYCNPKQFNWGAVGQLLNSVLPEHVTIATTSAGIIPFFCDRKCLDLHGLTDPILAHEPVTPETRGRLGHDHWLSDIRQIRERGAHVYLPFANPKAVAMALVTPPGPDGEVVSARLPDGKYVEFNVLSPVVVDTDALRTDKRLVFYGDEKTAPTQELQTLRERFRGFDVIDTFDVQNGDSHDDHSFEEIWAPGASCIPNFHGKMLRYIPPADPVTVFDEGRIIDFAARWQVHHVIPDRSLFVVARNDRTGEGVYSLEINGEVVPGRLEFGRGADAWDERFVEIPSPYLRSGDNDIVLRRVSVLPTEIYFFWFLQAAEAADPIGVP